MGKLKLSLINPQGNLRLPLRARFEISAMVDSTKDVSLELNCDNKYLIGDTDKLQIRKSGRSVVNWKLTTLRKTEQSTQISVLATSSPLVQMVQFNLVIA